MTEPSQAPGAPTDAGDSGQAPTEPQQPGTAPAEPQDISSLPQWAQDAIKKTRDEAAGYRTKYQTSQKDAQAAAEQRDKVLAALGMGQDEAPTPEQLGAQLDQFRAQAWETAVENKVLRMAPGLGLDADGLLDSIQFLESLAGADIDPDAADFADQLEAHVTAFVDKHPKFKTTPPAGAGRSGGDFSGGPTPPPASLSSQIAAAKKAGNVHEVIRLENLKLADGGQ